jgi:hypothetical protein
MVLNALGGLFNGNNNIMGSIQPVSRGETQEPYPADLGITDGDSAYDTMAKVLAIIGALPAGSVFTLIWEMTVPAQTKYRWGYGSAALPANQGYMWFASIDEGTGFQSGVLRLIQSKARETKSFVVAERADSGLHTTDSTSLIKAQPINRNELSALPEKTKFPKVAQDSLLQMKYRCIAAATAEDNVGWSIPATIYQ